MAHHRIPCDPWALGEGLVRLDLPGAVQHVNDHQMPLAEGG